MTRERIESLEADKHYFRERAESLQEEINRLRPENARLREVVESSSVLDLAALVLIGAGGGIISYATFVANVSKPLADVGLGALLSGLFLMVVLNLYKRIKK